MPWLVTVVAFRRRLWIPTILGEMALLLAIIASHFALRLLLAILTLLLLLLPLLISTLLWFGLFLGHSNNRPKTSRPYNLATYCPNSTRHSDLSPFTT